MDVTNQCQTQAITVYVPLEIFVNLDLINQDHVRLANISQDHLHAKMDFNALMCREDVIRIRLGQRALIIVLEDFIVLYKQ